MNFEQVFGTAEWIGTGNNADIPVIRDVFAARAGERAEITVVGFGVFILYINGVRAHDTECLPLASDYENTSYPEGEHRDCRIDGETVKLPEYRGELRPTVKERRGIHHNRERRQALRIL